MEQIKLNYRDAIVEDGHSSRGNQPKWVVNGKWYKKDQWGYEGLAETVTSHILDSSGINSVIYNPVKIDIEGKGIATGCVSDNFLKDGAELLPIHRIYRKSTGQGLMQDIFSMDVDEAIAYTVDFVQRKTGLEDFGKYLTKMLEFDAFFLNEDRHTNNIAVLLNLAGNFELSPYFDCGLALLSSASSFPFDKDIYRCIADTQSRPFSSFEKQVESARKLYGPQLKLNINDSELNAILNNASNYYPPEAIDRVQRVIEIQKEKYPEMVARRDICIDEEER